MKSFAPFFRIVCVFALVWTVSRTAIYLLPGDPAEYLVHESLVQTTPDVLREKMDLHRTGLQRIFSLPTTESLIKKESSLKLVSKALANSALLALISVLFSALITVFSMYAGFRSHALREWAYSASAVIASVPLFVGGPVLLLIFSVWLKILPPLHHPFLPALALSFYLSSFWFRTLQTRLDDSIATSPVAGGRARGLPEDVLFIRYALAPIAGSFAAYFGTQVGILLNGSLLVEVIFEWPGIGSLLTDSVLSRDYPVIELSLACVTLVTLCAQQLGYTIQKRWEPKLS